MDIYKVKIMVTIDCCCNMSRYKSPEFFIIIKVNIKKENVELSLVQKQE